MMASLSTHGELAPLVMGNRGLHNHPESAVGLLFCTHGVDSVVSPQSCDQLLDVPFAPFEWPQSPGLPVQDGVGIILEVGLVLVDEARLPLALSSSSSSSLFLSGPVT